jgi:putative flippase GtrA
MRLRDRLAPLWRLRMVGGGCAPVVRQACWFGVVGIGGFVVDAAVLSAIQAMCGDWLYSGQVVAYLVAATATWQMNRTFTFADRRRAGWFREWARYLLVNAWGGGINYAVFAGLISATALCDRYPVLAVAAGSIAGLGFNFTASRSLVFVPKAP